MVFASWRGVVGVVKPTHRPGSLEEFIRLLPEGIGVVPVYLNFKRGTEDEFRAALNAVEEKVAELAQEGVDLIHPEGAPPFMVQGYKGEEKLINEWEGRYKTPMVTAAQTQVEALRALNIKRFVGVTYFVNSVNDITTRYFQEAGFDVLAMDGMPVAFEDVGRLAAQEIYAHTRKAFLKHPGADGIYMLGTGWRCLDIIRLLEEDLQVPVVHAVPARVWSVQKRLRVRQRKLGFGKLLEEMP
jgi:maleate cis-trans isomerase